MVKRIQKAKSANQKLGTSVKKGTTKAKNEEKLSNGKAELKTSENKKNESNEEASSSQDIEEIQSDIAEQAAPAEMKDLSDGAKATTSSRKRRAAEVVADKKVPSKATKAKKQKVVIEIPKISSISGKVFVIGDNGCGQLGFEEDVTEKAKPALLDLPNAIVDIAAGAMHSVCLTENGEVITFGCNDEGALGRITTEESSEFSPLKVDIPERITKVSAGDSHSAALSESGQVYIWGNFRNNSGSMGLLAEGTKQCTPVRILNNVKVVKISSGCDHLACLSEDGVVYTCGNGEVGQLGRISEHLSANGGRRGMSLLLKPDKIALANSKRSTVNNVWTGSYGTFVKIQESGSIYAFGLNNYEQLGCENPQLENPNENPKPIFKPKQIASFNSRSWSQINGGLNHTLALDDNGVVYSLGRSEYGTLGLGENCGNKSVPTTIPSLQNEKCVDISCGNSVSFSVTDTGSAFSWGLGTNNQLGHGDESDQHVPKCIEGNFLNPWKAIKIAGGGQHTLILAQPRKTLEKSK